MLAIVSFVDHGLELVLNFPQVGLVREKLSVGHSGVDDQACKLGKIL